MSITGTYCCRVQTSHNGLSPEEGQRKAIHLLQKLDAQLKIIWHKRNLDITKCCLLDLTNALCLDFDRVLQQGPLQKLSCHEMTGKPLLGINNQLKGSKRKPEMASKSIQIALQLFTNDKEASQVITKGAANEKRNTSFRSIPCVGMSLLLSVAERQPRRDAESAARKGQLPYTLELTDNKSSAWAKKQKGLRK